VSRTAHYNVTCDDCRRFGSIGPLTREQTGWPPHDPIEVTACWPGGGLPPALADAAVPVKLRASLRTVAWSCAQHLWYGYIGPVSPCARAWGLFL